MIIDYYLKKHKNHCLIYSFIGEGELVEFSDEVMLRNVPIVDGFTLSSYSLSNKDKDLKNIDFSKLKKITLDKEE